MTEIVHDLVAAGVEGGSKSAIEREWSLADVEAQYAAWRRCGPPLNIAAVAIGKLLGLDLLKIIAVDEASEIPREELAIAGDQPTLTELTQGVEAPVPGGDTAAASRAIIERMLRNQHQ